MIKIVTHIGNNDLFRRRVVCSNMPLLFSLVGTWPCTGSTLVKAWQHFRGLFEVSTATCRNASIYGFSNERIVAQIIYQVATSYWLPLDQVDMWCRLVMLPMGDSCTRIFLGRSASGCKDQVWKSRSHGEQVLFLCISLYLIQIY